MSRYSLAALFVYSLLSSVSAAPIYRREVPQGKQISDRLVGYVTDQFPTPRALP